MLLAVHEEVGGGAVDGLYVGPGMNLSSGRSRGAPIRPFMSLVLDIEWCCLQG
jgi:hypothetical protein